MSEPAVLTLSYPDFVAFIGQANTPPGASDTVFTWIEQARINGESHILDLACTTGFSSRTICQEVRCAGTGIDLSKLAIDEANRKAAEEGLADRLHYVVGDAASLPFAEGSFSHVVAGGCFGFISERVKALEETARVLGPGGMLCVSSFHYTRTPPEDLLDDVQAAIGYRPDRCRDYAHWERFFSAYFGQRIEEKIELECASESEVVEQSRQFIYEQSDLAERYPKNFVDACYERFLNTRLVLNRHREFQGLSVWSWHKK